jgi:hypothetical protein
LFPAAAVAAENVTLAHANRGRYLPGFPALKDNSLPAPKNLNHSTKIDIEAIRGRWLQRLISGRGFLKCRIIRQKSRRPFESLAPSDMPRGLFGDRENNMRRRLYETA